MRQVVELHPPTLVVFGVGFGIPLVFHLCFLVMDGSFLTGPGMSSDGSRHGDLHFPVELNLVHGSKCRDCQSHTSRARQSDVYRGDILRGYELGDVSLFVPDYESSRFTREVELFGFDVDVSFHGSFILYGCQ